MAKKTAPLLPTTSTLVRLLGERLCLARRRRQLTAKQVAERAGMSPMTLRSVEHGGTGVTLGAYVAVMQVLGCEDDLNLLSREDPLGRELQDARLRGGGGRRTPPRGAPSAEAMKRQPATPVCNATERLRQGSARSPSGQLHTLFASLPADGMRRALADLAEIQRRSQTTAAAPPSEFRHEAVAPQEPLASGMVKVNESSENEIDWIEKGGFADSRTLAQLIDTVVPLPQEKG
jgi:transcriptional regulator with XRE-family HTH domain